MPVRDDPAAVLTRLLHAIDDVDYSSLSGTPAALVSGDEQIGGWRSFVGAFDATQHMTGPCLVDERDGGLVAQTHVRAYHRIGDAVWGVHGHYVVPLERTSAGWQIAGITLRLFYQEGDRDLPARAAERAGTSPRVTRRTTEARAGA